MMGRRTVDQTRLFYPFNLDGRVPATHLLRRINVFVTAALAGVHREMAAFYSPIGRLSIDPELLIRMLIVGYCWASAPSGGSARRSRSTSLTVGSAGSISTTPRFRITPASPRTDTAASATATCSAWCSSA